MFSIESIVKDEKYERWEDQCNALFGLPRHKLKIQYFSFRENSCLYQFSSRY